MKAMRLVTIDAVPLVVEAYEGGCSHWAEIWSEIIDIEDGTLCDICGEPITEPVTQKPEARL